MKELGMTQAHLQPLDILASLGINGTPTLTAVQGGYDLDLWKVESEGQSYALRVYGPERHEDYERERAVLAAARAAGLPAPEVRRAGIWHGHPALLITWMPGRTIADDLRARPWRVWRVGVLFGRMQA